VKVGLNAEEIDAARRAMAVAGRTDAILKLARGIVAKRGGIEDVDFAKARRSGLTDEEIIETVANVALNIFTNYINLVAGTVVDFPEVVPGVDAEMAGARRA
jgi:alkylhydroperoxidase family enzyme